MVSTSLPGDLTNTGLGQDTSEDIDFCTIGMRFDSIRADMLHVACWTFSYGHFLSKSMSKELMQHAPA